MTYSRRFAQGAYRFYERLIKEAGTELGKRSDIELHLDAIVDRLSKTRSKTSPLDVVVRDEEPKRYRSEFLCYDVLCEVQHDKKRIRVLRFLMRRP